MKKMTWSAIALAVSAVATQQAMATKFIEDFRYGVPYVGNQADAKGFVDGSKVNLYAYSYYKNKKPVNGRDGRTSKRDWATSLWAQYISGYTQGTVGFGVDLHAYWAFAVQEGSGSTGNIPLDSSGNKPGEWGKAGANLKARISKTQAMYGDTLNPQAPVFAIGGSGVIPQTATGIHVISEEVDNLQLESGHFWSGADGNLMSHDGNVGAGVANVAARSASFFGGKYYFNENLNTSLYGMNLDDIWNQYYASAEYTLPLTTDQSLSFVGNYYLTKNSGQDNAGSINNNTYGLSTAYNIKAHTFTVAFQKVNGDTPFDYAGVQDDSGNISTGDGIFLPNSVMYSDFNAPGEKSWKVQYDLDMADYGVPGLELFALYVKGDNISESSNPYYTGYGDGGKAHETDVGGAYTLQSGALKDLRVKIEQAWYRGNEESGDKDGDYFRVKVDYPLSLGL